MIVDASVHVWSGDRRRYPFAPIDGVDLPDAEAPMERMLGDLGAAGVGGAVLVQPRQYGYDHSYIAEAIRLHPERLTGICLVDSESEDAAGTVTGLRQQGFAGVRLISLGGVDGLAGRATPDIVAAAAENDMSISLLVTPARLAAVGDLVRSAPRAAFIVDHYGLCVPRTPTADTDALLELATFPNVMVRVSAFTALSEAGYPFNDLMPLTRALYAAFGGQRLLWGTDYPYVLESGSYIQSLDAVRFHMPFIAAADLAAILGGNAARIFRLSTNRPADLHV